MDGVSRKIVINKNQNAILQFYMNVFSTASSRYLVLFHTVKLISLAQFYVITKMEDEQEEPQSGKKLCKKILLFSMYTSALHAPIFFSYDFND